MRANFSFDVDCTNYLTGEFVDEGDLYLAKTISLLNSLGVRDTTWFIRIDTAQMMRSSSKARFLSKTKKMIEVVQDSGNSVGWHHHSSEPHLITAALLEKEFRHFGEVAAGLGIRSARSGFGQMTESMMQFLIETEFEIDSSCISRPRYSWEATLHKDWSRSPNRPYRPCQADYQRDCEGQSQLSEVPLTTVQLSFSSDTREDVRRYINLSYRHSIFKQALRSWHDEESTGRVLVTITHPYEVYEALPGPVYGDTDDFVANIQSILDVGFVHVSMGALTV